MSLSIKKNLGVSPGVWVLQFGVEVKVVDDIGNEVPTGEKGELVYRGHNVMKGYYNKPEANKETLKNGWLNHNGIASSNSRNQRAKSEVERKIPRRDNQHNTFRLVLYVRA